MRDELAAARPAGSTQPFAFALPMFEHARNHLTAYRTLAGSRGGAVALEKISQILSDLVREELAAQAPNDQRGPVARDFAVQYVVGAFIATMTWWLDAGARIPTQQMDAMFRRLLIGGIAAPRPS